MGLDTRVILGDTVYPFNTAAKLTEKLDGVSFAAPNIDHGANSLCFNKPTPQIGEPGCFVATDSVATKMSCLKHPRHTSTPDMSGVGSALQPSPRNRSEEHTSELQSRVDISYA